MTREKLNGVPGTEVGLPTVLRSGPYRFYFFSNEPGEPRHVHVDRDDDTAKFWIGPVALARATGFSLAELRRVEVIVRLHERSLIGAWDAFFGAESG